MRAASFLTSPLLPATRGGGRIDSAFLHVSECAAPNTSLGSN